MAKKSDFNRLRDKLDRVRKDSLELATEANRIVLDGVQRIADRELSALNDYYKAAVAALKQAREGDKGLRDIAGKQLDLLQESATQAIGHAREAVGIVAETRSRLGELLGRSVKEGSETARKLEDQAKAQVDKARETLSAVRNTVESGLKNAGSAAKPAVKKAAKAPAADKPKAKTTKSGRGTTRKLGSVLDLQPVSVTLRHIPPMAPSPDSRAGRATSKAKAARALRGATDGPDADDAQS